MADLSPAAQAVLDAALKYSTQAWSEATHQRFNLGIAAALRAAAYHVEDDWDEFEVFNYLCGLANELDRRAPL